MKYIGSGDWIFGAKIFWRQGSPGVILARNFQVRTILLAFFLLESKWVGCQLLGAATDLSKMPRIVMWVDDMPEGSAKASVLKT